LGRMPCARRCTDSSVSRPAPGSESVDPGHSFDRLANALITAFEIEASGRCLSFTQPEEIALGRAAGESLRSIAARLGRSPSRISRGWPAVRTRIGATGRRRLMRWRTAGRHGPSRKSPDPGWEAAPQRGVAWQSRAGSGEKYSPEQIAGRLRADFPDDPQMRVSAETMYQSLNVQSRGAEAGAEGICAHGRAVRRRSRKVDNARTGSPT
jgi:transposase, IS30 family